ncbi:hypothetical protein J1N35_019377 [Gossypium stocksii]|uniref:Uncharacterized protein n=1 Tax=Gossypium stocksii TaxID=47602 RepID=A0A9D3VSU5_9ROSI|nr:hypothetical protein J1N35_019377 [Gossypium stocksii]
MSKEKLKSLRQSHEESFIKFQEDTKKNIIDALPEWRLNLILHAQMAAGPLDLSQVDFKNLRDISTSSLNFIVYHPEGEEQKSFQREWKQLGEFIIPTMPNSVENEKSSTNEG